MKPSGLTLACIFLVVLLGGCASTQQPGVNPESRSSNEDNPVARLHTELGASYYARGQYAVALQELRIALAADHAYAPAYSMLGLVYAELREDKEAEGHFQRSIELSPHYSEAHNNYALFLCQRGRVEDGLKHYEQALANSLYATPEKALANAGNCALEKTAGGKTDLAQAELYFVRALKRAPTLSTGLLGMAEAHFRQDRWLAARSLLRQYSGQFGDLSDQSAQALWLGVRIERKLGDREAEANYGSHLRRRYPESMQTQWLTTGQYDQAGSLL